MPKTTKIDEYDFGGVATAYDVLCGDGRVIEGGAFDDQDGEVVPLVWEHRHGEIENILGHAVLSVSDNPPGMRVRGKFNTTKEGLLAKQLVLANKIGGLSIWANDLHERLTNKAQYGLVKGVLKGVIREVSLVPVGMNPRAGIDDVVRHSEFNEDGYNQDFLYPDGIVIHSGHKVEIVIPSEDPEAVDSVESIETEVAGEPIIETQGEAAIESVTEVSEITSVVHGDSSTKTVGEILSGLNDNQRALFSLIAHVSIYGEKPPIMDGETSDSGETIAETFGGLSEEQETVLYYMADVLSADSLSQGEPTTMTTNIFQTEPTEKSSNFISHAQTVSLLKNALDERPDSFRKYLAHSVTDLDLLFPDYTNVDGTNGPRLYVREMAWVDAFLNSVDSRPFSRIKSLYADLTADDARARGYVTGNEKAEQIIAMLRRVTGPQTVYVKQKLDRDDLVDITDFAVVQWMKSQLRMMFKEEVAKAALIEDGRSVLSDDKIMTTNVRPIYGDDPIYTHPVVVWDVGNEVELADMTAAQALELVDTIASSRQYYKGSGDPTMFCSSELAAKLLLVRDTTGRRIHETMASLASALRVRDIVEVTPMSGMTHDDEATVGEDTYDRTLQTLALIVNPRDYTMGADRGGELTFFEDFDIDFNAYRYLYEGRVSGALTVPKSAISIDYVTAATVQTP